MNPRGANQEIAKTGGKIVLINDEDGVVDKEIDQARTKPNVFQFCGRIESFMTDLEFYVREKIQQADAVTACVAWFTNRNIIEVFGKIPCRVAVQREDWLRSDGGTWNEQQKRERYKRMKTIPLHELYKNDPLPVPDETAPEYEDEAVRCVGHSHDTSSGPREGRSLMHHKFYVFYHRYMNGMLVPYAVMTGSANSTANMTNSVENMLYVECPELAKRYHQEFLYIYGLSSPSQSTTSNPTFVFNCAKIPRRSPYFASY